MNIEEEINKIINNIDYSNYDNYGSLSDIEELKTMAINKVFDNFMFYKKNTENKERAFDELDNYAFIDINDLKKGDYIRYFNLTVFYDIRLVVGGTVIKKNINKNGDILIKTPYGVKIIKQNIFFKRIKKDDLVKIKLVEMLHDLK